LGLVGYGGATVFQWWTLALEFDRWTTLVCKPTNASLHPEVYPFNDWREYSRGDASRYDKDTVISADDFFVNAYVMVHYLENTLLKNRIFSTYVLN
jgi:hypothetical protein